MCELVLKKAQVLDPPASSETSRKARKTQAKQTPLTASFDNAKLPEFQQKLFDAKLLRWLVMCGISFATVQSPFFLDFMQSVRKSYIPAGNGHSFKSFPAALSSFAAYLAGNVPCLLC